MIKSRLNRFEGYRIEWYACWTTGWTGGDCDAHNSIQ